MKLTERELTAALQGASQSVLATQDKEVRKGRRTADEAWQALSKYQRYVLLDGLSDQVLPVLVALPDVEVPIGERPSVPDAVIASTVAECAGEDGRGLRGKVVVAARVALVKIALANVPPRADPDAFVVPDHL
jgi:hypothetical protein